MFNPAGPWPVSDGILARPVAANDRKALTYPPVIQFWGLTLLTLSMHTTGLTHGCSCLTVHSLHGIECSQF